MRKPKLRSLKPDSKETMVVRSAMKAQKSIKITINIDFEILQKLKRLANETGVPYQRLLNRTLQEGLAGTDLKEERLDRIEREIKKIKMRLAG